VGLTYRLPFELSREDEWEETETISGVATTYTGSYDDAKWTMPWMIGTGLAYRPSDNFTLAFDYEHRHYSSVEYEDATMSYDLSWNNVNQFRVGMEYLFVGSTAVFPVRLGFRTNPQIYYAYEEMTDASFNSTYDSTGMNGMVFTGGFGMKFGRVWFDVAGEYGITTVDRFEHTYWDNTVFKDETKENSLNVLAACIVHF
jgi:hypothetical protein